MANPPIVINKPNIETVSFDVFGTQPMIQHKWSEKAKKQMLDKQMKKATKGREPKNPEQDFYDSLYLCSDGKHPKGPYGFPAVGFKSSAVRAAKQVEGMTMTDAKAWFYVIPDDGDLVRIYGPPPVIREDMVKIQQTTDIRFRGQFNEWRVTLNVRYNMDQISSEQLLNLFELAGFSCGVGEWRMEHGGTFGTYTLIDPATALKKVA